MIEAVHKKSGLDIEEAAIEAGADNVEGLEESELDGHPTGRGFYRAYRFGCGKQEPDCSRVGYF